MIDGGRRERLFDRAEGLLADAHRTGQHRVRARLVYAALSIAGFIGWLGKVALIFVVVATPLSVGAIAAGAVHSAGLSVGVSTVVGIAAVFGAACALGAVFAWRGWGDDYY